MKPIRQRHCGAPSGAGIAARPEGYADWVEAWSEDYGLTAHVDACVLGGRMYPGYEQYWTTIQNEPDKLHPLSGHVPTPAATHYVLAKAG